MLERSFCCQSISNRVLIVLCAVGLVQTLAASFDFSHIDNHDSSVKFNVCLLVQHGECLHWLPVTVHQFLSSLSFSACFVNHLSLLLCPGLLIERHLFLEIGFNKKTFILYAEAALRTSLQCRRRCRKAPRKSWIEVAVISERPCAGQMVARCNQAPCYHWFHNRQSDFP